MSLKIRIWAGSQFTLEMKFFGAPSPINHIQNTFGIQICLCSFHVCVGLDSVALNFIQRKPGLEFKTPFLYE